MNYRKATIDDLDELVSLGKETFRATYSGKSSNEEIDLHINVSFHPDKIKAEILNPESEWYLTEVDDETAGFIKLNTGKAQTNNQEDNSLEVERIYLKKKFQGLGLGKGLMNLAVQIAREKEVDSVWLGVWEENSEAIAFYKHYGFRQDGIHPFNFAGEIVHDLLMRFDLKK